MLQNVGFFINKEYLKTNPIKDGKNLIAEIVKDSLEEKKR